MFQINVPHFLCHGLFLGLCCCTEHTRNLQQAGTRRITGMRKGPITKHANQVVPYGAKVFFLEGVFFP